MNTLDVDYPAIAKRMRAKLEATKAACKKTHSVHKRHDFYLEIAKLEKDVSRLDNMVPVDPTEEEALSWLAWGVNRLNRHNVWWGNKLRWDTDGVVRLPSRVRDALPEPPEGIRLLR